VASVTSQLTRINDLEGTLTSVAVGGGAGATANTDIFIQGAQSLGRRQSNVTLNGFMVDDGAGNDLSAADIHVGLWIWVTHYAVLTALRVRIASNSGSGNYDEHIVPLTEYPSGGGWIKVWLDISRTPDATGGTALDEATARYFGPIVSLPTVGGNAQNLILDAIDRATAGLLLTGTVGLFSDFVTADEGNTTNKYGVVTTSSGIIFCRARLTLGSASSLAFDDSGFTIVFPQQNLVADTFMGITVDLQNASTSVVWANGSLQSPGTKKGDLVVTGTSGDFTATVMAITGLRVITLNAACVLTDSVLAQCGTVTVNGADVRGSSFVESTVATDTSAAIWNVATDPDGFLDNTTFTKGANAHHGIELGTSSPTSVTLRGITASGFNAADGNNDSFIHVKRTTGTVTINWVGGSGTPSYKSDGATVVLVVDPVTTSIEVLDNETQAAIQNAYVVLWATGTGPYPSDDSVSITQTGGTATVTHTGHGLVTGDVVRISGCNQDEYNGLHTITVTGVNAYTFTVPSGTVSPATGTPVSSLVFIDALTGVTGIVSATRTFASDQDVTGFVRKGTSSPVYVSASIVGTIDSAAGLAVTVQLVKDE
jgi:hypothetical protein